MTPPTAEADTSKPARVKKKKKSTKMKKEKEDSAKETTDPSPKEPNEGDAQQETPSIRRDTNREDADKDDDVKSREPKTAAKDAKASTSTASPKGKAPPRSTGDGGSDALRQYEKAEMQDLGDTHQRDDSAGGATSATADPMAAAPACDNTETASKELRLNRASEENESDQEEKQEEEMGAANRANVNDGVDGPEVGASAGTAGTAIRMSRDVKWADDDAATARVQPMVESGSESDSVRSDPLVIPTTSRASMVPSSTPPSVPTKEDPADGNAMEPAKDPFARSTPNSHSSLKSIEAGNEQRMILAFKIVLALVVLLSAAGVAVGAYYFALGLQNEPTGETALTAEALNAQANLVHAGVQSRLEAVMSSMDDFQANIVAQARVANQTWPFVFFPNLAPAATRARYRAGGVHYMAIHPLVAPEQRQGWEAFGEAFADRWIVDSLQVQSTDELYEGPSLYDGNVLNVVHDSNYEPVPADYEVLLPTWQNSPVVARLPCYNWDLFSLENVGAVNRTYRAFRPVLGEAYTIPDPTDNELDVVEAKWWSDRFRDYVPFTKKPYEPISNLYYPIIDWDQSGLRTPQIFGTSFSGGPRFVGILMMVLYWRDFLHDVALPLGSPPVDVVLTNPCHPPFTYRIHPGGSSNNSSSTVYMGRDDAASTDDPAEGVTRSLSDLTDNYTSRESSLYTGLPLDSEYCPFSLSVLHPAAEASLSSSPSTESGSGGTVAPVNPAVVSVVAAAIVGWTALIFVAYLATVEVYKRRRNTKQQDEDPRPADASTPAIGSVPAAPPAPAAAAPPSQQE